MYSIHRYKQFVNESKSTNEGFFSRLWHGRNDPIVLAQELFAKCLSDAKKRGSYNHWFIEEQNAEVVENRIIFTYVFMPEATGEAEVDQFPTARFYIYNNPLGGKVSFDDIVVFDERDSKKHYDLVMSMLEKAGNEKQKWRRKTKARDLRNKMKMLDFEE